MFYITAHTVTKNQFTDVGNADQLVNVESRSVPPSSASRPSRTIPAMGLTNTTVILVPSDLNPFNSAKNPEKGNELPQIIIANGLR